jgi:hypothetical protein
MRTYKKPMITVDSGLAEGVYAASGSSQGTLNFSISFETPFAAYS